MVENSIPDGNKRETVTDMVRRFQEEILEAGGQDYLDRAERAAKVIRSWYADHELKAIITLSELQALKPEQIATVMSSMQAIERVREKAMKDPQLAKEILYKCLDGKGQKILEEMLGGPIGPENAGRALSYIDIYRLADAYLKQTYVLCLGPSVNSVRRAWEKA